MRENVADIKDVVLQFNKEVIAQGSLDALHRLLAPDVINHAAPAGAPNGKESFSGFLMGVLHAGLSDIHVTIHDMVAENDLVATRKTITGTHTGTLAGIPATGRPVEIKVMDMVRVQNGRYAEHWGHSNMHEVLAALQNPA